MVLDDNNKLNDDNKDDADDDDASGQSSTWDKSDYDNWEISKQRRFNIHRNARMHFSLGLTSSNPSALTSIESTTAATQPCIVVKKSILPLNYNFCPHCLWQNNNSIKSYRAMNAHLQHCVPYKNKNTAYEHSRRNTRSGWEQMQLQNENLENENSSGVIITDENSFGVIVTDEISDEIIDDLDDNFEESTDETEDETRDILQPTHDDIEAEGHPSNKLLKYQHKLIECCSKNKLLHVRRHRLKSLNGTFENIKGLTDADYIDLASNTNKFFFSFGIL